MPIERAAEVVVTDLGKAIAFLDGMLGGAVYFPFLILGAGVLLTVYLGFPQVRFFRHAFGVVRGRYTHWQAPGDASHAQSLATAIGGMAGTGNIGGVALSVTLGGPAALLWMWVAAFVGMGVRYCEVTLAHAYRETDQEGRYIGGPMYYMEKGLGSRGLAVLFAVTMVVAALCTIGMQSGDMTSALDRGFDVRPITSGLVLAALVTLVISGGSRRIAIFSAAIVPIMTILYVAGALSVAAANYDQIPTALAQVLGSAFTGSAATAGFLGASFTLAVNSGVSWALVLNEAGEGSAPVSHAMAKTEEPVAQGVVSILGPFVVTFVITTATFLAVLSSGVWNEKFAQDLSRSGIEVVSGAFSEENPEDVRRLYRHLGRSRTTNDPVTPYSGALQLEDGRLDATDVTLIANRSIVEDLLASGPDGQNFDGTLSVVDGVIQPAAVTLNGFALVRSVPLIQKAFDRGFLPGGYFVLIILVLFGFSTAVVWAYCGNRAITYLLGTRAIVPFRIASVGAFLLATLSNVPILYSLVGLMTAVATLPNLLALVLLRKELRARTEDYRTRLRG